jgi:hypothetical protein
MSDTPETDLLLSNQHHDCVPFDESCGQLAELCRKLEEKRDQWRKCAERLAGWMRGRASFDESAVDALDKFERLKETK